MKILFISSAQQPDYLCDSLYHGLKTIYGKDVEAVNDMWYMYDSLLADERQYLYGRGFSLYGLLNSEVKNVPLVASVINRIQKNYYNYIIYGSIQQCKLFLNTVVDNYPTNKIIFIDGEDRTSLLTHLIGKGFYFKRELLTTQKDVYPIAFAIPAEKIVNTIPQKSRNWAINYPGKLNTYIHKTEDSYYTDYKTSKFAVTFKKAGWDCLRHYEILANGCLPYFKDLVNCPESTMVNFPKKILLAAKTKFENESYFSDEEYNQLIYSLLDYTKLNLTTETLAKYVIETADNNTVTLKNNSKVKIPDDDVKLKANFIDSVINKTSSATPVIIHHSLSSLQELRYLKHSSFTIYAESIFQSALGTHFGNEIKVKNLHHGDAVSPIADVIILDMTLPYQENILDYMQTVIKSMRHDTKLIIVIPNYKSLSTVLGIIKNDLKFGRLTLAKSSQVNFYSKSSIIGFLSSLGLQYNNIVPYSFDDTHVVKRFLNKISSLKFFTCKKLLIEAELKNE